jgi:uncharacterized protein YqgV (UPF0045/DUF77 family)
MEITVEISMYPLQEAYKPIIIEFIQNVKSYDEIEVEVNPTATHVYGEYDEVMRVLSAEIKSSFEKHKKCVVMMKVLNGNLKESLLRLNL